MVLALLLFLALTSGPAASQCLVLELETSGRSAHGSAIMLESAPHQLIRALDPLLDWAARTDAVEAVRIVALEAAPAINIIPRRALAVLEVSLAAADGTPEETIAALQGEVGPRVEIRSLDRSCRPRAAADS